MDSLIQLKNILKTSYIHVNIIIEMESYKCNHSLVDIDGSVAHGQR